MNEGLLSGNWSGIPTVLITLSFGLILFVIAFVVSSRFATKFAPHFIIGITVGVLMAIISMNSKICSIVLNGHAFPLVLSSLFFPVLALSSDVLNEFWGEKHARKLLYCQIVAQLLMYFLMFWFVAVPAISEENQNAFVNNFALATRGFIASVFAMFVCNLADISLYNKLRKLTKNKHLWNRVLNPTLLNLLLDIGIYTSIVFVGTKNWPEIFQMMKISAMVRVTFCFIEIPTLYLFYWLKKKNIFVVDDDMVESSVKAMQVMGGQYGNC